MLEWLKYFLRKVFRKKPVKALDVDFIKKWEGLSLDAYRDVAGVWTIGYGHTGTAHSGMKITEKEAEELLKKDLEWAEEAVLDNVKVDLKQNEFDALVSFTYNVGAGAFKRSTLLRKLNEGDFDAAASEFSKWIYANGRVIKGLRNRRADEARLFRGL